MTFRSLSPPQRAPPSGCIDKDDHCSVMSNPRNCRRCTLLFSFNLSIQKHSGLRSCQFMPAKVSHHHFPSILVPSRLVILFYRSLLLLLDRTIIHGTQMHPIETKHSISLKRKTHRTTAGTARWLMSCLTVSSERKAAECQQL